MKFFCDGHADTFRNLFLKGASFFEADGPCHLSHSVLWQAQQNLQIMAIYTPYQERGPESTVSAFNILMNARRQLEQHPEDCKVVLDRASLQSCLEGEKPCVLFSLEGADPLGRSLEILQAFYELGLRAIGLTHNHNSCAAGGCAPPDCEVLGLRPFGHQLLAQMSKLGMLLDTAHLGRKAFDEVMAASSGPVINSHSCCRKFVDLERNLEDSQMRDLADSGGLVAVTYVPKFLTSENRPTTSEDVFRHLEHMVEVVGIEAVGLGSDFDGVDTLPTDLKDPRDTPNLVDRMQRAGWSESDVEKVLGGNWYRVLNRVLK